jgi:dodecin
MGRQTRLQRSAHAAHRGRGDGAFRRSTGSDQQVGARFRARHGDGPGAVGDQPDPGAGLANLRDQLSVPGATQNTPSDRGRCPHSGFTEIFLLWRGRLAAASIMCSVKRAAEAGRRRSAEGVTEDRRKQDRERYAGGSSSVNRSEEAMPDSVYRVTEVIGVSSESWEAAARSAVETAANTVRDLRVAEVVRQDVVIEEGRITGFRVRLSISFKYESGD